LGLEADLVGDLVEHAGPRALSERLWPHGRVPLYGNYGKNLRAGIGEEGGVWRAVRWLGVDRPPYSWLGANGFAAPCRRQVEPGAEMVVMLRTALGGGGLAGRCWMLVCGLLLGMAAQAQIAGELPNATYDGVAQRWLDDAVKQSKAVGDVPLRMEVS